MTDADLVRAVYRTHALKRLAQDIRVTLRTSRRILHERFSASRRREVALALRAELEKQAAERAVLLARVEEILKGD